jgi:hypothetical protein
MAITRSSQSGTSTARRVSPWRMAIWLVALVLGAACFTATPRLRANASARDLRAAAAQSALPSACVSFLKDERCWLRGVGNEEERVERAIADERAVYQRWHESAEACRTETQFETPIFEETGCVSAANDPQPLPVASQVDCPAGTFFFVRQDGHVSGCRQTCTVSEDCDDGSRCSSIGTAAGGPVLESFCE